MLPPRRRRGPSASAPASLLDEVMDSELSACRGGNVDNWLCEHKSRVALAISERGLPSHTSSGCPD